VTDEVEARRLTVASLCVPVQFREARDLDTISVSLPASDRIWWIRLLDCWAPELHDPRRPQAKETAIKLCQAATDLWLYVPLPAECSHNLLAGVLSFDRLLGVIWLDEHRTLNQELVAAGVATREKKERA
jgi:endonuclease YncB( thermonuclease family)